MNGKGKIKENIMKERTRNRKIKKRGKGEQTRELCTEKYKKTKQNKENTKKRKK